MSHTCWEREISPFTMSLELVLVLVIFIDHYIDGTEFMNLSESDVTGMVPPIGLHQKIIRFLPTKKVIL